MSVPRDLRRSGGAKSPETRGVVWEVSSRKERAVSPRLSFQVELSPERVVQAARRAERPGGSRLEVEAVEKPKCREREGGCAVWFVRAFGAAISLVLKRC